MTSISQLLSSEARTSLLELLCYTQASLGVRPLARLAGILPHSAATALRQLVEEGIVMRADGQRPTYRMNLDHSQARVLRAMFDAARVEQLRIRAQENPSLAQDVLRFANDAGKMISKARGTTDAA